ncbi:MAG: hypothetical protein ACRDPA_14835 [Solirubrobacteraceae bacterium]
MLSHGDNGDPTVGWRLARVLLVMGGVIAAVTVAISSGAVRIPGVSGGSQNAQASEQPALAAQRTAADKRWASATCTSILDWKNEIKRDGTSLNLSFGPGSRVKDAISATTRLVSQLDKLGLPPGGQTAQAQAELNQLRSDITSHLRDLQGTANSIAGGNLAAIGTLVTDLENDKVLGTQIAGQLRHVVTVDLGLSLVETRACRQLAGSPI